MNVNNIKKHFRYLISSEEDKAWGLTVSTVGHQTVAPNAKYPVDEHPNSYLFSKDGGRILEDYQLLYISHGQGYFTSKHQPKVRVTEGTMFLLFPGEWHSYYPDTKTGWSEYWIGFGGVNIYNRVSYGFFSNDNPLFNVGVNEAIVTLYSQAIDAATQQKAGFQIVLAGIVNHLLGLAYTLHKNTSFCKSEVEDKVQKAKVVMQENIYINISPADVSKQIGVGYSWFRKTFKEYTGLSPAQYILEIKISKAKDRLTNSDKPIKEIAYELSFENVEYFSTMFKRKTNTTPVQYRNMTRYKVF